MKKVSIIIPVYNVSKYLPDCIESLVNQTYANLEFIFVDDGSTDDSGVILDQWAIKDRRIKVIHQKNSGASIAKNIGIDLATGYYLTFMDSDDVVESSWISTMVQLLEANDADLAECAIDKFYTDHFEKVDACKNISGIFDTETYMAQYLDRWTNSLFYNKLFKNKLASNIRFRNERRCIDDEFYTYKVLSKAKKIVRTEKILYHYRQRKSSAVQSKKNQLQITDDAMELRVERYEWIKKYFFGLRKMYICNDINFLIYFANNSVYDDEKIKKYKKVAKYYFKEALKLGVNIKLLKLSVQFVFTKPVSNENKEHTIKSNSSKYFE